MSEAKTIKAAINTKRIWDKIIYILDFEEKRKPKKKKRGETKREKTVNQLDGATEKNSLKVEHKKLLLLVLALAFLIRMYFFVGLNLNDDLVYVNFAHQIATGKYRLHAYIFSVRLLMNYPIGFFFKVFGVSDYSAAAYILITSLGSVLVAFYIGKVLFDEKVGLISALLMSVIPIEVSYATTIVPDTPVAFYMGLSMLFFLIGEKRGDIRYSYLSGVMIGFASLVKSLGLLIIFVYAAYFLLARMLPVRKHLRKQYNKVENTGRVDISSKLDKLKYALVAIALIALVILSLNPELTTPIKRGLDEFRPQTQTTPHIKWSTQPELPEGVARINAYNNKKNVYWDVETNRYSNKKTRWDNAITEDLEYNLNGNKQFHALREDIRLMAVVDEPFEQVNCTKQKYSHSYVDANKGRVFCMETLEGNYVKIKVINSDEDSVTFKYDFERRI